MRYGQDQANLWYGHGKAISKNIICKVKRVAQTSKVASKASCMLGLGTCFGSSRNALQGAQHLRFVCNNMLSTFITTTSIEERDAWAAAPLLISHFTTVESNNLYVGNGPHSVGTVAIGSHKNRLNFSWTPLV